MYKQIIEQYYQKKHWRCKHNIAIIFSIAVIVGSAIGAISQIIYISVKHSELPRGENVYNIIGCTVCFALIFVCYVKIGEHRGTLKFIQSLHQPDEILVDNMIIEMILIIQTENKKGLEKYFDYNQTLLYETMDMLDKTGILKSFGIKINTKGISKYLREKWNNYKSFQKR